MFLNLTNYVDSVVSSVIGFDEKPTRIGISGAHRVGKTTLAKKLAYCLEVNYLDNNLTSFLKMNGYTSDMRLTLDQRIRLQDEIFDHLKTMLACDGDFVFDRSPIDLLGYLLSSIDVTASDNYDDFVIEYIKKVIDLANETLSCIIFVPVVSPFFIREVGKSDGSYVSYPYRLIISNIIENYTRKYFRGHIITLPDACQKERERVSYILKNLNW